MWIKLLFIEIFKVKQFFMAIEDTGSPFFLFVHHKGVTRSYLRATEGTCSPFFLFFHHKGVTNTHTRWYLEVGCHLQIRFSFFLCLKKKLLSTTKCRCQNYIDISSPKTQFLFLLNCVYYAIINPLR